MTQPTIPAVPVVPVPTPPPTPPVVPSPAPSGTPAVPTPPDTPPADQPLGPAGERALAAEREERKALAKQLADLAPLKKLAEALGAGTPAAAGKSEVELLKERFAQHETELATERAGRFRAEVASEKGLTAVQAARLKGSTREELAADADDLLAAFPPASPGTRAPAPDPSQGARGAAAAVDYDTQIREAQSKGDYKAVIRLNGQKMAATKK